MKKLLSLFLSIPLLISPTTSLISCSIGSRGTNYFLSNLPNFNWNDPELGDGIIYDNYSNPVNVNLTNSNIENVEPKNLNSFLNYDEFNTGFQWNQNIKKQAVTGVPLNKGFMPNGNFASDFGVESKAQSYRRLNGILDWNPNTDNDAKFNTSNEELKQRVVVPNRISANQDERLKYNPLGFSSRKHRTFDNTIVGTKNPFENSTTNWQYINEFINWSGSWFEGPIVPPPADVVDFAHKNGTPVYGNIFLDGYHGLTREMIRSFILKDNKGNYKIVDVLINIAKSLGFDGWFINNEANGQLPNGTILDYNEMFEIIRQFQQKTATSKDEKIKNLELYYYRNDATLAENNGVYSDKEMVKMADANYLTGDNKKTIKMQVNFGELPESSKYFREEHKEYQQNDIFTMVDQGFNNFLYGSFDFKELAYKYDRAKQEYDPSVYAGFSSYLDNGSGIFANEAYNYVKNNSNDEIRNYLFANQVGNLFNDIQFSGTNLFVSSTNKGLSKNELSQKLKSSEFNRNAFIADPRVKLENKGSLQRDVPNSIFDTVYDYKSNNSKTNTNSYGIADLIPEQTVITDQNLLKSDFKTNFSTGNGIKFKTDEYTIEDYPWTNRRLADVLPTYRWRIYDKENSNRALPIDQFYGGFDYDEVYNKGNSIAIGSGFDEKGKILPVNEWDTNKTYNWDILGTDFSNKDKKIELVYKTDSDSLENMKLNLTIVNKETNSTRKKEVENKNYKKLNSDWTKIESDLNNLNLSTSETIAGIGLTFKPKKKEFKLNVGEVQIINQSSFYKNLKTENQNINLEVEYAIKRKNLETYNLRLSWEYFKDKNFDYFEILTFFDNKWYRVGETTSTNYFLKDLKAQEDKILLCIRPKSKTNIESENYKFFINL
ncbi:endo-beta-N-acetylglucosaminidase [Spiroplasma floricola]|uniref:Cytosolic endo-beta-N-acetylglucosaminidase TIM barrel domain-containing protein n=1 Tax=Spiroplasma floricola 23-6 TaxID=1336749 RepID=A0A2K8SCQ9_9MOLU|nr:hypothetical protein [Spiroplasma floricola]AUB31244.1 hypothetical protein SFLOR_v1c01830 [Spiroplasma floricola 23-6]